MRPYGLAFTIIGLFVATLKTVGIGQIPGSDRPPSVAITHVTVIDTAYGSARPDMSVVVTGARITEIGKSDTVKVQTGSFIIDGRGRYLVPGLWDMHVHVFNAGDGKGTDTSEYSFPLLVANGVVGVRDMRTDSGDIVKANRWNADIAAGQLVGPRFLVTSRIVDGDPPNGSDSLVVRTAEDGRAAVRSLKASGARMIKVYWNVPRDAYFAIATESKRQHIRFGGHVPYEVGADEASNAGQLTIEHLDGVDQACSSKESDWRSSRRTPADVVEMRRTFDVTKCSALADRFRRNGTWLVPTAVVFYDPTGVDHWSRLKYASPGAMDRMNRNVPKGGDRFGLRDSEIALRHALRRVGPSLFLAGTDLSRRRPTNLPGFSLHDELALFVEFGFTPAEALRAATYNAAKFANGLSEYGTVEKGKRADLVLLNANPLEDIRNSSKIDAVMLNGTMLDRSKLDALLSAGEAAAKRQ